MEGRVFYMEFRRWMLTVRAFLERRDGMELRNSCVRTVRLPDGTDRADAAVAVQPAVERGPNVYMETSDLESALERVKELGGTAGEIRDIPPPLTAELPSVALDGRFAGCKDSEGNMFHLWQRNPEN